MITAITGATGQLGRLVVADLSKRVDPKSIVALARSPEKAGELGVSVREADYDRPETLDLALKGVDRLLLISASEVGRRVPQHAKVVSAAVAAGVQHVVYTSLLRASDSPLSLAAEHRETEELLRESGLPITILRNGWYTENYTGNLRAAIEHGAILGSAGEGRIASATRFDFAQAAAIVLSSEGHVGRTYELVGDKAYTLAELASEVSRQSGKDFVYKDLPEAEYAEALRAMGLPEFFAQLLANCDAWAKVGALFDESKDLSRLLGRPTTSLADAVRAAL